MARYYTLSVTVDRDRVEAVTWTRDPAKGSRADLPGVYCPRTNLTDWDAERLWRTDATLTDLEAVFRCLKSELGLRPIRHRVPRRTEGHPFIATFRCADGRTPHLRKATAPEPHRQPIYDALGVGPDAGGFVKQLVRIAPNAPKIPQCGALRPKMRP